MDKNQFENPTCPSFNGYSSDRLAEIATKVTDEFKSESRVDNFVDDDGEFEFSLEVSAEEVFNRGPVFPIFNRDLYDFVDGDAKHDDDDGDRTIRAPLKNLFLEEREVPSSSSSEADEMEAVPPGTYCVWRPKNVESSPATCKKSKSTGSASRRFRIRDFIRRSNSEGKESFVFLTPKKEKSENSDASKVRRQSLDSGKVTGKSKVPASPSSSAHEQFYVKNRAMKQDDKRKSYLPYRKDLVGFFANVNGLGKAVKTAPPY